MNTIDERLAQLSLAMKRLRCHLIEAHGLLLPQSPAVPVFISRKQRTGEKTP